MTIVFPEDTEDIIDGIRDAIGRDITFVSVTTSGCPVCSLDPVTNQSTDSFCPVCSGLYWIPTPVYDVINAHVTWGNVDFQNWYPGGYQFEGDARAQIKYTLANLDIVDNALYVYIDNKVMEIKSFILRGVQNINRILIDMIEREKST